MSCYNDHRFEFQQQYVSATADPFAYYLFLYVVYRLPTTWMKDWAQLVFSACNSVFVIEEILRTKFAVRARRRVQDDEIGDVNDPVKQDKTLRIDMNRLSTALKKNIFA